MKPKSLKFVIWDLKILTSKVVPILFSLVITFLICKPLLLGKWYPMHDSTHVSRVTSMTESIRRGEIPPIWADGAGNGYGYPLFHFYAPLFHLSASLVNLIVGDPYLALKVIIFISTFVGTLGIYYLAGIIGATAFLLSPYLAVNLYVRGAFSEFLSLMLLPWVFLALKNLTSHRKIARAGIAISLFLLAHNLIPLLVLPVALIWSIYFNKQHPLRVFLVFLLAGLLTSWFLIPVIFERGFTQADTIAKTTNYALHFVDPSQIWNSTWGFGGSGVGVEDGMSFKLGKLQIILAALGLVFAIFKRKSISILLGIFTLIFFFLATPYSRLVWDKLPLLQIVQFPWRALGPLAFILAVLASFSTTFIKQKFLRITFSLAVISFMIFLNLKYFVPRDYEDTSTSVNGLTAVIPEYFPRDINTYPLKTAVDVPTKLVGPTTAIIDRAYYPTWQGTLNGIKVPLRPSDNGLVELDVPVGEHDFKLIQSHTKLELFSYAITLLALGYMMGLLKERT